MEGSTNTRFLNASGDLRNFIEILEEIDELKVIDGADWNCEIGAITEYLADHNGPAVLFDNIKDYPAGHRVIATIFGSHKLTALTLGCPLDLEGVDLLKAWREKFRNFSPVPPEIVKDGPVMENVMEGDDVDLNSFPAPIWHEHDGGRFLGTGCGVITMDPDTGVANIGTYRCQIQEKNTISVKVNKGKHGRLNLQKYHEAGKPCPVAISMGHAPSLFMAGWFPINAPEYDVIGWLQGFPAQVITSPYTGLPLPATGEIVLEGEFPVEMDMPKEGPFGEWPGYYADTTVGEIPLMDVKRVYYRNNPIILGVPPLKPPNNYIAIPLGAVMLWDQLETAGIPGITGVWGYVYSERAGLLTVISIKQSYAGHSKQTLLAAVGASACAYGGKFVVVVDEDINVADLQDVIWAITTRCHVRDAVDIVKDVWISPADPALPLEQRFPPPGTNMELHGYTSDRVLIDACRPYRWKDQFPLTNAFSDEEKEKVARKWNLDDGS